MASCCHAEAAASADAAAAAASPVVVGVAAFAVAGAVDALVSASAQKGCAHHAATLDRADPHRRG